MFLVSHLMKWAGLIHYDDTDQYRVCLEQQERFIRNPLMLPVTGFKSEVTFRAKEDKTVKENPTSHCQCPGQESHMCPGGEEPFRG